MRGAAGIQSAALANFVIFNDAYVMSTVRRPDDPKLTPMHQLMVAPGYWRTLRIPLFTGRGFTDRDDERAPRVAVLNESLAERLFPHQNPLGKRILVGRAVLQHKPGDETEVVGLVKDTKVVSVTSPAGPHRSIFHYSRAKPTAAGLCSKCAARWTLWRWARWYARASTMLICP